MTRKDYEKFATMLKDVKSNPENSLSTTLYIQGRMEAIFKADNPRFDIGNFSKAAQMA